MIAEGEIFKEGLFDIHSQALFIQLDLMNKNRTWTLKKKIHSQSSKYIYKLLKF